MKRGPGYVILFCLLFNFCPSTAFAQSETREELDKSTAEDLESLFDLFGDEGYDDLSTVLPPAESEKPVAPQVLQKQSAPEVKQKPAAQKVKQKPAALPSRKPVSVQTPSDADPVPESPTLSNEIQQPPSLPQGQLPVDDEFANPFIDDPGTSIAPFALPPSSVNAPPAPITPVKPPTNAPDGINSTVPRFELDFSPSASDFEVLEPNPPTERPSVAPVVEPTASPQGDFFSSPADDMELFEPSSSISDSVIESLDVFSSIDASSELPDVELDPSLEFDATSQEIGTGNESFDEFSAPDESFSEPPVPELEPQPEPFVDPQTSDPMVSDFPMYESDAIAALPFCEPELEMQTNPFGVNLTGNGSQYPNTRLTGFFHADYSWFSQNSQFFGDDQDYRGFRRARMAAVGSVADNIDYMLEMDFGFPGRPQFMDVWMDIQGSRFGTVRVGQWRQPFGLGELNSVMDLVFHERASMLFLGPFRQTGVGIRNHDGRSTYAASAFGSSTDPFGNSVGDSNYGMAARVTTLLFDNPQNGNLLHLGAGYSHIQPGESGLSLFVPQEMFGPRRFSNIGPLLVLPNQTNLFNTELAAVAGPWHAQAEVRYATSGGPGPDFFIPAAYAQIGYVLTGETRKYHRPTGSFRGGIDPFRPFGPNGRGAWEVALRFSHIDLNDSTLRAGRNNSLTIGLNWYLNRHAKFQFNYLDSKVSRNFVGRTNQDVGTFALRAQVAF